MFKIINIRFLSSLLIASLSFCVSPGQACPTGVYTNTQTGWGLAAHSKKQREKKSRQARQQTAEKLGKTSSEAPVTVNAETDTPAAPEPKATDTPQATETNNSNTETSK